MINEVLDEKNASKDLWVLSTKHEIKLISTLEKVFFVCVCILVYQKSQCCCQRGKHAHFLVSWFRDKKNLNSRI